VPNLSSDPLARDDAYRDLSFPTAVDPLFIWLRPRVGSCVCAARTTPLIAKIELAHSIASIRSSCSQGWMSFSAPTGFRHPQVEVIATFSNPPPALAMVLSGPRRPRILASPTR